MVSSQAKDTSSSSKSTWLIMLGICDYWKFWDYNIYRTNQTLERLSIHSI